MKAKGWIVLIFTLAAVAAGVYILWDVSQGGSFAFGGDFLSFWGRIAIVAGLAVVLALLWFFGLRGGQSPE